MTTSIFLARLMGPIGRPMFADPATMNIGGSAAVTGAPLTLLGTRP
jgi:hypothetical protein